MNGKSVFSWSRRAWSRERAANLFDETGDFYELQKNNDIARKTRIYYYFLNHCRSDSFHDEDESDRAMLIQRSSGARRRQKESTSKFKAAQKRYEPEWWKTFVALIYLICCLFLMTVTETIVHDHVPGKFIYLEK